jgi:hypothetical protein
MPLTFVVAEPFLSHDRHVLLVDPLQHEQQAAGERPAAELQLIFVTLLQGKQTSACKGGDYENNIYNVCRATAAVPAKI